MFQNYFKIAVRNLFRSKIYSFINISGLSLGIACCLLLALYVQDDFSYDRHHQRLEDLYRIDTEFQGFQFQGSDKMGTVSPPIAMTLRNELPEVESAARVLNPPGQAQNLIQFGDNIFYETDGFIADSTLFEVLTYKLLEGNPRNALTEPNTVVISETLAHKIFGQEPALDKSIFISQTGKAINFKITGVFEESKSFLHANFFTSMMSEGWGEYLRKDPESSKEWAGQNFVPSYLKLVPGHSREAVEKKINDVLIKYGSESMKLLGIKKRLFLEPLKDIYLKSPTDKSPRITYLYIIASIALFILLIACINFMNLSTAKATKRASEMGIRKALGAFRSSLIRQIFGEAMVIVTISVVISVILAFLALPLFNELSGKSVAVDAGNRGFILLSLIGLTLFTGFIAGSYPAFYMSSFQPAQVLKGKFTLGSTSGRLRQVLVIFQFIIAIVLVCGVIVISRQLTFMREKDLGFNAHAKIVLPLRTDQARNQYEPLKKQLQQSSSIEAVSGTRYVPGNPIFNDMMFYPDGGTMETAVDILRNSVDAGYLELMNIKLLAGRNFTTNRAQEENKLIVNKATAVRFGIDPSQMVGQALHFEWQGKKYNFEVIGVMDDFNQTSLKDKISPTLFEISKDTNAFRFMVASVASTKFSETIASLEKTWKSQVADTPFEYSFLDDSIQKQYDSDRQVSRIITSFTVIAIIICSLGLYGLSSFMAERRFKEIGIRKVMGASVNQIVGMMSKEFIRLVVISFVISVPLAWYIMNRWLESFAYKIPMNVFMFIYAGLSALVIALVTISYESFRAASANPVNSLRNE